MSRSLYNSGRTLPSESRSRLRSYSPKDKYKPYERDLDGYDKLPNSKYDISPYSRKDKPDKLRSKYDSTYDKLDKYSYSKGTDHYDSNSKYDRYDKFGSKYEKTQTKFDKLDYGKYDKYGKDHLSYDKLTSKYTSVTDKYDKSHRYDKIPSTYNGSDKYRSDRYARSLEKSPVSFSRPLSGLPSKSRYDDLPSRYSRSTKDYTHPSKSTYSDDYSRTDKSYYDSSPYKSSKSYDPYDIKMKAPHPKRSTKSKDSYARSYDDHKLSSSYDLPSYESSYIPSSSKSNSRSMYDTPSKKPRMDTYDKYNRLSHKSTDYKKSSKYESTNNNSYERYVIGDSVVYGSPGREPDSLYSPAKTRSDRLHKGKSKLYSPFGGVPEGMEVLDRIDSFSTYSDKRRTRRDSSKSPVRNRNSYFRKDSKRGSFNRNFTAKGQDRPRKSERPSTFPRPTSPPKPLLSINLSARSIGLSRHRVKQTLTIDEGTRRRVPLRTSNRIEERDVKRKPGSLRDTNRRRRPDDLRLWIESRKSTGSKTKRIDSASRSAALSATVQKIRLMESKRRLAAKSKGPMASRLTKGKLKKSSSKTTRVSKRRSKSPKEDREVSPKIDPNDEMVAEDMSPIIKEEPIDPTRPDDISENSYSNVEIKKERSPVSD